MQHVCHGWSSPFSKIKGYVLNELAKHIKTLESGLKRQSMKKMLFFVSFYTHKTHWQDNNITYSNKIDHTLVNNQFENQRIFI